MNRKRILVVGILGMFLVGMMGLVLGGDYSDEAGEVGESIVSIVGGFFGPILEPLFGEKEMMSRVFFALLLGMIIYSIVSIMFKKSHSFIKFGITGAITSLALLGLPSGFLESVRVQYGAMGATILTIIPFMIVLLFSLKAKRLIITRVTWLFYAGYYFAMYFYEISNAGGLFAGEKTIPYMAAWIIGLILFFVIGSIRRLLFKGNLEGLMETGKERIEKEKIARKLAKKRISSESEVDLDD